MTDSAKTAQLEMLRKIARLADLERNPSRAEAEAAMAKLQSLMDKYQVTLAEIMNDNTSPRKGEVQFTTHRGNKIVVGGIRAWHWSLGRAIARVTNTKHFLSNTVGKADREGAKAKAKMGGVMSFFGPEASARAASELWDQWLITIEGMAKTATSGYIEELKVLYVEEMEEQKVKDPRHLRGLGEEHPTVWRLSWLAGLLAGIHDVLNQEERKREENTVTAIVVVNERLMAEWKDFSAGMKTVVTPSPSGGNYGAYLSGKQTGKGMSLTRKQLSS